MPPHLVQDLERATFSNIEHQGIDFVMHSLQPWVVRWEQCMNKTLLSPEEKKKYQIRLNVDGLLRGDQKSRYDSYAVGIVNGFLSPNDIRKLEHLPLIPDEEGGNRYYLQGAMVPLKDAGIYADKARNQNQAGDDNKAGTNSGGKDDANE